MQVVVLSPHRDDAAFSCGLLVWALVEAGHRVRVLNVFTRSVYAPFGEVPEGADAETWVTDERRREDEAFVAMVEMGARAAGAVELRDAGWKDAPLRLGMRTEQVLDPLAAEALAAEAEVLAEAIRGELAGADAVLAPLGMGGHVDHRVARDSAVRVVGVGALLFYEDLPYACRMAARERGAEATERLREVGVAGVGAGRHRVAALRAGIGRKQRMAMCYCSQIADETAWEMERDAAEAGGAEWLHGTDAAMERLWGLLGDDAKD